MDKPKREWDEKTLSSELALETAIKIANRNDTRIEAGGFVDNVLTELKQLAEG